jgi:hypothetical protein
METDADNLILMSHRHETDDAYKHKIYQMTYEPVK